VIDAANVELQECIANYIANYCTVYCVPNIMEIG